jgi:hypothetical protein
MDDYFEEYNGTVWDAYEPTTSFDPLYYSSGESITASSDAQNVDFGSGTLSPTFTPDNNDWSFGYGDDSKGVDYTVNGTPESDVSAYGTVPYQAEYSNEGRNYPTSSSARDMGVEMAQPVTSYGVMGQIGAAIPQLTGLINAARGGMTQVASGGSATPSVARSSPATPTTVRVPISRSIPQTQVGNEARQTETFVGQLGGKKSILSGIDPMVILGGGIFVAALFL